MFIFIEIPFMILGSLFKEKSKLPSSPQPKHPQTWRTSSGFKGVNPSPKNKKPPPHPGKQKI